MNVPRLSALSFKNKRVLLRVDFNVPLSKDGVIENDARLRASLPTISYILEQGAAQIFLMSHLGRPKGIDPHLSLKPCAKRLAELLQRKVAMAGDCIGPLVKAMKDPIVMLENLRFHPGEEDLEKEPNFAKELASLGDVYVNDAFGAAHRDHVSVTALAQLFPGKKAAGCLLEKEIAHLSSLLQNPERPFYALLGGAKVASKIGVIKSLLERVDTLFVGGGLASPFLQAKGFSLGASSASKEEELIARELLSSKAIIELPVDLRISPVFGPSSEANIVTVEEGVPNLWYAMDIGPLTIERWEKKLSFAKTVFWNGPLGVFEMAPFSQGTFAIAKMLSCAQAQTTIGGGDSLAAIETLGLQNQFAFLSTGGGASLEFLEYGRLPGIDSLVL
jgi:phosphoglycerate kinase